jgi:short-subunit dehydrogenase
VLSFTEALHSELRARGVRVTVLCPGPVATEFATRAGVARERRPAGAFSTSAEQVAEQGYRGLMRGRRLVVPGLANKIVAFIAPLVPRRVLLAMVDHRQARRRETDDA